MLVVVVNMGILPTVPPVVVTLDEAGGGMAPAPGALVELLSGAAGDAAFGVGGAARTKAEGGSPPMVCASNAFIAYGTATRSTRGCSGSLAICTASQRASPFTNRSGGMPFLLVAPS